MRGYIQCARAHLSCPLNYAYECAATIQGRFELAKCAATIQVNTVLGKSFMVMSTTGILLYVNVSLLHNVLQEWIVVVYTIANILTSHCTSGHQTQFVGTKYQVCASYGF